MKASPILFSAPMILALLAGRKSQTRRIVEVRPRKRTSLHDWSVDGARVGPCPYGQPGDLLYVKEAWRVPKSLDDLSGKQIGEKAIDAGYRRPWCPIQFEADKARRYDWRGFGSTFDSAEPGRYRHARFMPGWASRLTLRLTEVRVERLQEISDADAIAEGIVNARGSDTLYGDEPLSEQLPHLKYRELWESINGKGSWSAWSANPFVWALTFSVIKQNVADVMREAA